MANEIALLALCYFDCEAQYQELTEKLQHVDYGGIVEGIETLGFYSPFEARLVLDVLRGEAEVASYTGFGLYRVTYLTDGVHTADTKVSALMAVPFAPEVKGVVSWQHGTASSRESSISKPSVPEGIAVAALFASDGFVTIAPDYIGLGVSTERQAYYHMPSTVSTIVDGLHVAEAVLDSISAGSDKDLYLAGFSQGGGATAATQRFLERENPSGLQLRAAASISGASHPREISFPHFMGQGDPFFIAMTMQSFAHVYQGSLDGVVREPYRSALPQIFDGTLGQDAISEQLPASVSELMTEQFMQDYDSKTAQPKWFYDGLDAARTSDYAPAAPLRIYYGSEDVVVVPEEAHQAVAAMQALGGNVEEVAVGAYGHDEMVINSLPSIQQWFDSVDE